MSHRATAPWALAVASVVAAACGSASGRPARGTPRPSPTDPRPGPARETADAGPGSAASSRDAATAPVVSIGLVVSPGHVWSGDRVALAVATGDSAAALHVLQTVAGRCSDPAHDPGGPVAEGRREEGLDGEVLQSLACSDTSGAEVTLTLLRRGDALVVVDRSERLGTTEELLRVPLAPPGAALRFVSEAELGGSGYRWVPAQ